VRFVAVYPRKDYLRVGLWVSRPSESPRVVRTERFGPDSYVVTVVVRQPDDVDDELRSLIRAARARASGKDRV
jgi:hypothetical protein